ncbi:MAG: indole-3-glycerol phosphate synthase TrpC [Acidobacteriota bacterium]|nr:indole-3-glycerol phosphate synthase TrpC [Acidobacteriota bacterium]
MPGNVLTEIVKARQRQVQQLKRTRPLSEKQALARRQQPGMGPRSLYHALRRTGPVSCIAEMKKASPSRGLLRDPFEPIEIAVDYESNGAAAVSVLTEENYFLGSTKHLESVRRSISRPVLRKDFILDPYQIYESAACCADAVLLIAAILTPRRLLKLKQLAERLGLEALVEVHDRHELKVALDVGARLIGVNNRDLKTFEVNLSTSLELAPHFPESVVTVSESGIRASGDIRQLREAGYDAFLIGELLMKSVQPGRALRELMVHSVN